MSEREISIGGRVVMARDSGDPRGKPVLYFHGTPGSRLDLASQDLVARDVGVRLISFDRPGYGGSSPGSYDLMSVAEDARIVAETHDVDEFAVLGWSGGGPFALASAATTSARVIRAGVAGGVAPFTERPGATATFTEADLEALSFLPDDPARAAEAFRSANSDMLDLMSSVRDDPDSPWMDWMWGATDADILTDVGVREGLRSVLREGLRQGVMGIAWDNVAWCGPWGVDLDQVTCPVHLWYGQRDEMVSPENGTWLRDRLLNATLTTYPGEGHLLPLRHWADMLRTLIGRGPGVSDLRPR